MVINFSDKRWDLFTHRKFISILKSANPSNYQFQYRDVKTHKLHSSRVSILGRLSPPPFVACLWIRFKVRSWGASVCARIIRKFISILSKSLVKQQRPGLKRVYRDAQRGARLFSFGLIRHSTGITEVSIDFEPRRNAFLTFFSFV